MTPSPLMATINMILPSTSCGEMILNTASYTNMPVINQMIRTEISAPKISARWKPYDSWEVGDRLDRYSAASEIRNDARSDNRCAASVRIAKLLAMSPPVTSPAMNSTLKPATIHSFLLAISLLVRDAGARSPRG